jgi:hypothetical protein
VASALLENETLACEETTLVVDCIDAGAEWRRVLMEFHAAHPRQRDE